jgi:DNA-binding GntR family transcriptional regulator
MTGRVPGAERIAMLTSPSDLTRTSLRDQALTVIREGIVSGDLAPGGIYSATAIATQLGVSASPVREAMLTLVNQGLMEPVRNRGFRVLPLDSSDRREIYEIRMMLEIPAMVSLAGNEEIKKRYKEFRSIAKDMVKAGHDGDLVGYLDIDRKFHLELLAYTRNQRLLELVDGLRDQTRLYGLRHLSESGTLTHSTEEHLAILDAIVGDDANKIRDLMESHFEHIKGDWAEPAPSQGK